MYIRRASKKETNEILKHAHQVFIESTNGLFDTNVEKAKQINSLFLSNGGYYLIWYENDTILGWIGVGITFDPFTDEEIGIIPELYVLPPHRNKGIAKKLCHAAMNNFRKQKCKRVQLNVFENNLAKNLYRILGFRDIYTTMEKVLD